MLFRICLPPAVLLSGTDLRTRLIFSGTADRLIFGPGDELYGRGEWDDETAVYGIFREGNVYIDPETDEVLGFEATQVGAARVMSRKDDIVTLKLTKVNTDVCVGDRLMPTEERRVSSLPSTRKRRKSTLRA